MGNIQNNILLVEDDAIIALNQKRQLEKHGYTIIHVLSGEKSVETVKTSEHKIDLILMDIDLGMGIDGTQAAKRILESEDIPVIFLSSHTEPEVVEKTEIITSYGYVVKNSGITVLDASIKMAFKLFAAHKDILKHKSDAEKANKDLNITVNNLEHANKTLIRLERAIETTNDIVFITNRDELITYINPQFTKKYGYTKEETLGKLNPKILNAENITDKENDEFWDTLQKKKHLDTHFINKTKNGKLITVETSIDPIFNNNGKIKEFVQIQRDITEQILAEKKILKSNSYLGFLNTIVNEQANTNNFDDLVNLIIQQLKRISNAIFVSFSEYDSTDRLLKNMKMAATQPILDTIIQITKGKILDTEIPVDDEYYKEIVNKRINKIPNLYKNTHGAVDPIISSVIEKALKIDKILGLAYIIDNKLYGTSIFTLKKGQQEPDKEVLDSFLNISAISLRRLQLENEIRESEKIFRGIYEQSTIGIYRTTPEGKILLVNPSLLRMLGYKNFEEIKKWDLNSNDYEPSYDRAEFKKLMEKDNRVTGLESEWTKRDGTKLYVRESAVAIRDKNGQISYYQGMVEDISDKKQIENIKEIHNQLSENANTMQSMLNNYEEAIWSVDKDFKFTFINSYFAQEFKSAFGIELKPGMHAFGNVRPELQKIWKPKYETALKGERTSFEFEENALRGKRYFRVNLNPIHQNGIISGVSAVSVDITKQKLSEYKFEKERRKSQQYLDIAGVMFVAMDREGSITLVNKKLCETTGYTQNELIGKNWVTLMMPVRLKEEIIEISRKLLKGEMEPVEYYENLILLKNGEERLIAWHNTILTDEDGNITGHLSSGNDITDRKKSEEKIENLLAQKELILKEVHHRIKNNMTTLVSLISLQAGRINNTEAVTVLAETENRIRSMMVLYDKLYRSTEFESTSIKGYLSALIDNIIENFSHSEMIEVKKKLSDFQVDTKTVFNIGIIINELITNAMKYAFKDRSIGKITISAELCDDNIILVVGDDGIGMGSDIDIKTNSGFGLQLVHMLVTQMDGEIHLDRKNGTKYTIKWSQS